MKFLKRILGICETGAPEDQGCWSVQDNTVVVGMERAKEILRPGGAMRLEGKGLPHRILLFHGLDGKFYAVKNKCTHIGGRRLDLELGPNRIQCCSVMGSVFNYKGEVKSGPAKKPLTSYPVKAEQDRLIISLA